MSIYIGQSQHTKWNLKRMKIEEQELFTYSKMAPHKNYSSTANGILLGFHDMFEQSMHHESVSVACSKRKLANELLPGQGSDPFPRNQRARVELLAPTPNVHDEHDWQYDFNRTIASLNAKHGAIDKDCNLSSDWMKRLNLFGIWGLLKQLETKKLDELDISSLSTFYNIVRDAEKMDFNVKWLHERLDDIRVAVVARQEAKRLEASKNEHIKERKKKEAKLKWFKIQVKDMEDRVTAEDLQIEDLNAEINNETAKFQRFKTQPLLDGLI